MPRWLFVCTGNLCRSPMAEGLCRATLEAIGAPDDWAVDSAGTHALEGRPPAPLAVEVAGTLGADISTQRSRAFDAADFADFDHVVALDAGHLDLLGFLCPEGWPGRLTLLPGEGGRGWVEVPDPYGQPRCAYEHAGSLIAAGVAALIDEARRA